MIVLPFNRCQDSSQYSPSSSLSASCMSCNDSAVIFKQLAHSAFTFFHRFFQPHFFSQSFWPTPSKILFFFCTITLCRLFFFSGGGGGRGRGKQAGSLPSLSHVFHATYPSITRESVRNRSISHVKTSGHSYATRYFRRC